MEVACPKTAHTTHTQRSHKLDPDEAVFSALLQKESFLERRGVLLRIILGALFSKPPRPSCP